MPEYLFALPENRFSAAKPAANAKKDRLPCLPLLL